MVLSIRVSTSIKQASSRSDLNYHTITNPNSSIMITLNTTPPGGHETIHEERPQETAEKADANFDHEPQKDASGKGEQRDLLAETLDKWELFQAQQGLAEKAVSH